MTRVVSWFSCGASSAVATKLAITDYPGRVHVVTTNTKPSEHSDNYRFHNDCETWFGQPIIELTNPKYATVDDVIIKRRYLNGPAGALCTVELKKKLRHAYQQADDIQVFGFTADEQARADRFRAANPEVELVTPLIDRQLTSGDCVAIIERAGIEIPAMYRLGYSHNNCLGCVKGGAGYWNRIRTDFPDVFARRAGQERELNASCIQGVFLDELDPTVGDMASEPMGECSLLCVLAEQELV